MQIEQMPMLRVFYEKMGRAKYTSHLDVMRMMTRALRRSGLPLWYTQGFNPHLYITFALPLPLGYEGLCESMDMRLTEEAAFEEVTGRLNAVLPPGFRAVEAATPLHKPDKIAWADYAVTLPGADPALGEKFRRFHSQSEAIEVKKRSKKGEKLVDIKPLTEILDDGSDPNGAAGLRLRCAAGNSVNIAPGLLLEAFCTAENCDVEGARMVRTAIRCADGAIFR